MSELIPVEPATAVNDYVESIEGERADETVVNVEYRLRRFIEWHEADGIEHFETLDEMNGYTANKYRDARTSDDSLASMTKRNQLGTFRCFVKWCEDRELAATGLSNKIDLYDVPEGEEVRDEKLESERIADILAHLKKYEWGSRNLTTFWLLVHTGMRMGALRGIDLDNWHPNASDDPYIEVLHRPESGTPLKNKNNGERNVSITNELLAECIEDYIDANREDVTDEHGRSPLFTSMHGRYSKSGVRNSIYNVTRPEYIGEDCEGECGFDGSKSSASECPNSVSPHVLRKSAITKSLNDGASKVGVSARCDVSGKILDKHYDKGTKEDQRARRRGEFDGRGF
jgi:site-specific recombinase XerD